MVCASKLLGLAMEASSKAYAPYSGFRVGAALLTKAGSVIVGVNVENASYGLSICAERVAIGTAVTKGLREFTAIAIWNSGDGIVSPCGACLQVLAEFSSDMDVIMGTGDDFTVLRVDELLPRPFGRCDHD